MKTSSCKAKGREFQQRIRDMYRAVGHRFGLVDADIESRGMGQQGVDLILSPAALRVFNHSIECKKHHRVVVPTLFMEHLKKYKSNSSLKLLFSENDRSEALVTMQATDFLQIVNQLVELEQEYKRRETRSDYV